MPKSGSSSSHVGGERREITLSVELKLVEHFQLELVAVLVLDRQIITAECFTHRGILQS